MEQKSSEFPVLIGQSGPINGQRWVIKETILIGRDSECDVVIPDRQVSRYHARFTNNPDGVSVEDLGSKNGTYCNGKLIAEPIHLEDGDLIQVALVQSLVFLSSDATMPMELDGAPQDLSHGRLYLDPKSRRVWIGDKEVVPPLSVPQFRLLQALYEQQGRVVARQDIINSVWGDKESLGVTEQALDALVRRLRERLSTIDPDHDYIVTIRGHGLRLDNPR